MSRSGYCDDCDDGDGYLQMGRWNAQVASATRGKRGQAFFRALVAALDGMPVKRLIAERLEDDSGEVCALGALGRARGVDMRRLDTEDHEAIGKTFDIARQLAAETMYTNDDDKPLATPEERWASVRKWAARQIVVTEEELVSA